VNEPTPSANIIGRASATEYDPNTSDKFSFWLGEEVLVNPFDIVQAEHFSDSHTYGLVTMLEHRTDAGSHLANWFSNSFGDLSGEPNTARQGTTIARAAVLSNDADIYMPVQNEARIRFANAEGVHIALGITDEAMPPERRIPAGLIALSNGTQATAYIDRAYVLGPEGAHVSISGISGLATKTSYAMFLLQALFQTMKDENEVAAILLNVKHGDLLQIDQEGSLSDEDKERWKAIGLEPRPFEKVRYLLPAGKEYFTTFRPNSFALPLSYNTYAYALTDTADKLDLLFSNIPDPSDTIDSLVGEIANGIINKEAKWKKVTDWNSLLNDEPLFDSKTGKAQNVGDIRAISVARFRRQLRRMAQTRSTGLFVKQRSKDLVNLSKEIETIRGGEVVCVDIARLTDWEQTLVFGDILRTICSLYVESDEETSDLPRKVVIFVDELNKFAPSGVKQSAIVEQILDVAERGRSIGIVLFSAQQFLSAVHPRVPGNASTVILGRNGSSELSQPEYRFLDPDVKMNVTRLGKGELLLSHATYRQPVRIVFPRPAYKTQTD
jgi:hypothetical protein